MLICPSCAGGKVVKNGKTYYGKQNHKCKDCNRQFVIDNQHAITENRKEDVRALLLERISLHGICRSMGVSMNWLLPFAENMWAQTPNDLGVNYSWLNQLSEKIYKPLNYKLMKCGPSLVTNVTSSGFG